MADPDQAQPIPKRFWWLKRLLPLLVLLLAGVAGLRWYWGSVMTARLEKALPRIEKRGEPTELRDLDPPPVRDDRNAAVQIKKGAA